MGHKANEAIRTTKLTNCQGLRMRCIPSPNGADRLKWFTVLGLLSRPCRTAAIIRWKLSGVPDNPRCRAAPASVRDLGTPEHDHFDNHEWCSKDLASRGSQRRRQQVRQLSTFLLLRCEGLVGRRSCQSAIFADGWRDYRRREGAGPTRQVGGDQLAPTTLANHLSGLRVVAMLPAPRFAHFDLALSSIVSTTSSNMLSVFGLSARYSFQAVCCANRNQAR